MYFAVQSMAAEMSTAILSFTAINKNENSIAFIIVGMQSNFLKKATRKVTFKCADGHKVEEAISECIQTKKAVTKTFKTIGTQSDGTVVAEFFFTWSYKLRS